MKKIKKIYININGKLVDFAKLPCAKCEYRYSYVCPQCNWNKDGKYNTYEAAKIEYEDKEENKIEAIVKED